MQAVPLKAKHLLLWAKSSGLGPVGGVGGFPYTCTKEINGKMDSLETGQGGWMFLSSRDIFKGSLHPALVREHPFTHGHSWVARVL